MTADSQLTALNNEVKLKAFEAERTQLVHEETCRVLKQTQLDNEKLHSKLDVSALLTCSQLCAVHSISCVVTGIVTKA